MKRKNQFLHKSGLHKAGAPLLVSLALASAMSAAAQSVPGAYSISRHDLRGTARFMSMGGAFGALGGDLSVLSQNPGGIGIYRNSDVGFTLDLDFHDSQSNSLGEKESMHFTKFNLNSLGGVFTLRLPSQTMPNMNFGFTYQKVASFDRRYKGFVPVINNSLSNYIAGMSDYNGLTVENVETTDKFDPYNPPYGAKAAPWLCIMGYDGLLTNPEGDPEHPKWYGQFGEGTTGCGSFTVFEKGYVDEYNIALGGNIKNTVFWGLDVGVTALDYRIQSAWGETLDDAYVYNPNSGKVDRCSAYWDIYDNYRMYGTGVNFKLGVIVKPIQELRLGFAFHTPTFYNLTEKYSDVHLDFDYPFKTSYNSVWANDGYSVSYTEGFQTPWRIIASAAGVISNFLIVSADYEWEQYSRMNYYEVNEPGGYDPWYDWNNPWWYSAEPLTRSGSKSQNPYSQVNDKIRQVYRNTSTLRLGAEFRVTPNFSTRVGYSFSSSPVKTDVKEGTVSVPGTGVLSSYTLDNATNYVTCGVGYKNKGFYADLAYVYRTSTGEYFPFTPDASDLMGSTVKSKLTFDTSTLALTLGFKF